MKNFHFFTIAAHETPAYSKKEFMNLQDAIYAFIGYTYQQDIDGQNHLKYLLENERCELSFNDDKSIAYIYIDYSCTYICDDKAKLFDFILEKDYRIEKYDFKTKEDL